MIFFKSVRGRALMVFPFIMIFIFGYFNLVTAGQSARVLVFAAASTTNAIQEIGLLFAQRNNGRCVSSFASSSTLAKQIQEGAPANVFISANPRWMDFLVDKGLIEKGTRCDILGNRIVLIAPFASDLKIDIHPGFNLSQILAGEKISMGDPEHVPVGIYGKQALESLGVWNEIAPKVVRAKDVRTALVFVERGEVPLGIVYATDAAITDKVRVVGIFPEHSHSPVTYQAAIVRGNNTRTALVFFNFLKSSEARIVFEKYGFSVK